MLRPRHFEPDVAGIGAQPNDAMVRLEVETHILELLYGTGGEAITASFLAGVLLLLRD